MRNVRISRIWWSPGGGVSEMVLISALSPGPPKTLWIQKELAELDELAEM